MIIRSVAAALLASTSFALAQSPEVSRVSAPADWTGPYAGVTFGAHSSDGEASLDGYGGALLTLDVSNGLFPQEIEDTETGAIGGVTLGYNRQRNAFVGGVEIDFSFGDTSVRHAFSRVDPNPDPVFNGVNTNSGYETDIDGLATARLRAGYAFGNSLVYATGGLALGQVENRFTLEIPELGYASPDWSESGTRVGYVIGAGLEHQMTSRINFKAEVLSYDLKDTTVEARDPTNFPGQSIDYKFDNAGIIARVGLNVRF